MQNNTNLQTISNCSLPSLLSTNINGVIRKDVSCSPSSLYTNSSQSVSEMGSKFRSGSLEFRNVYFRLAFVLEYFFPFVTGLAAKMMCWPRRFLITAIHHGFRGGGTKKLTTEISSTFVSQPGILGNYTNSFESLFTHLCFLSQFFFNCSTITTQII